MLKLKAGGPSAPPPARRWDRVQGPPLRTAAPVGLRSGWTVSQPVPSLPRLLREQWIRAKYERQEFTHPERQEPYSAGEEAGTCPSVLPLCLSVPPPPPPGAGAGSLGTWATA